MIPNLGMCMLRLMAGDYEIIIDLFYFLGLPICCSSRGLRKLHLVAWAILDASLWSI